MTGSNAPRLPLPTAPLTVSSAGRRGERAARGQQAGETGRGEKVALVQAELLE
jgi:hypothetical protein